MFKFHIHSKIAINHVKHINNINKLSKDMSVHSAK